MIRAWLVKRRETAAARWLADSRLAHLLMGTPCRDAAFREARHSRARLRRADLALDLWTLGGQR